MQIIKNLDVQGFIAYWVTADCHRDALKQRFEAIGFNNVVPYYRNNASILSEAAREYCSTVLSKQGRGRYLVRPLKEAGVTIIEEVRGLTENQYPKRMSATVDEYGRVSTDPLRDEYELGVIFDRIRDVCPSGHVTQALVRIVDQLKGFSLKENGGIYWLPDEAMAKWEMVEKEVELCTLAGQKSSIYAGLLVKDDKAMRMVSESVVREIQQESNRIKEEILSGGLGKRALAERERQANHLMAKIKPLQDLLGDSMALLASSITSAADAATAAMFQLEADANNTEMVAA